MQAIRSLIKRHMLLFFKDTSAVFFSFMAVFVVLFLYVAFLGNLMIQPLEEVFPNTAREISDTWIMAGTIGLIALTSSLSVLGIVIEDKSHQIMNDFYTAPITRLQIAASYIISTLLITILISIVTFGVAQIYIIMYGGHLLSIITCIKVLGCMLLSIFSCTTMLYYIMSFFKSASAFSNVTTIIGTLSGFLMGIYVPIHSLPVFLQTIIKWFPPSHGAALFRQIMMEDVMERSQLPSQALYEFQEQFGLRFHYGDHLFSMQEHILVLCIFGLCFLFLIWMKRRKA